MKKRGDQSTLTFKLTSHTYLVRLFEVTGGNKLEQKGDFLLQLQRLQKCQQSCLSNEVFRLQDHQRFLWHTSSWKFGGNGRDEEGKK